MKLDKVIKDLEVRKKAGMLTCNIKCLLDQLEKVTESVVVDKFVADWYEEHKDDLDYSIWNVLTSIAKLTRKESTIKNWIDDTEDAIIILVKMHLFGYKVKKEKKYTVKITKTGQYLYCVDNDFTFVTYVRPDDNPRIYHTKDELESGGFSGVFDNPMFEVEEVEE